MFHWSISFRELSRLIALFTFQGTLCLGHYLGKRLRLINGQVREHLAIECQRGELEAVHELRIIQTIQTGRGADANNPKTSEIALLQLASGVSEIQPALA